MRYVFLDANGRVTEAFDDSTVSSLPDGAVEISVDQWNARFDLRLVAGILTFDPIQPDREAVKSRQWFSIKAERDRRSENGGYKVGAKWFHSDQKSRSQQLGLVLLGASIPAGLQWKTMDGSFVIMTAALAQQVLAAAAASDQAIFTTAETHKAAMEASAAPAEYDFSADWPDIYEP